MTFPLGPYSASEKMTSTKFNDRIRTPLNELKVPRKTLVEASTGTDFTTTGTSFADISTTHFQVVISPNISSGTTVLMIGMSAMIGVSSAGTVVIDFVIGGVSVSGGFGVASHRGDGTVRVPLNALFMVPGVTSGSKTIKAQWKVTSLATGTLYARHTTTPAQQPQFWVWEMG